MRKKILIRSADHKQCNVPLLLVNFNKLNVNLRVAEDLELQEMLLFVTCKTKPLLAPLSRYYAVLYLEVFHRLVLLFL